MEVQFVILAPAKRQGAVTVRLPIMVGRSDEAKFRIQQDSVSRRHCELFRKGDHVYVRDLGSTNGTFLDGEQIPSAVASMVKPGSEVRVGPLAFRVEYESGTVVMTTRPRTADDTLPLGSGEGAEGSAVVEAEPVEHGDTAADASGGEPEAAEPEGAADAGGDAVEEAEPAEPAAEGFGFLGAGSEATPPEDDDLNDFFKSMK